MLTICVNHMKVEGKALDVVRFKNASTKGPTRKQKGYRTHLGLFCFESLVPTPDHILENGNRKTAQKPKKVEGVSLHRQATSVTEWRRSNWGCEEDICNQKITSKKMGLWFGSSDQGSLDISFKTFDEPPLRWFETVFAQFPELIFHIHYELHGQFAHGYILGEKGELWESGILTEPTEAFCCDDESEEQL